MYVFMIVFLPLASVFMFSIFASKDTLSLKTFSFASKILDNNEGTEQKCIVPENPWRLFFLAAAFSCFYIFIEVLCIQSLTYRQIRNSVFINWLLLFVFDYLIPTGIMFLLVFFASKKTLVQKISLLFPFMLGFYSVYLIYTSLLRYEKTTSFLIFVKPLLVFCFIFMFAYGMMELLSSIERMKSDSSFAKFVAINSIVLAIGILFPAFIQAMYATGVVIELRIILTVLYIIFCMVNLVRHMKCSK